MYRIKKLGEGFEEFEGFTALKEPPKEIQDAGMWEIFCSILSVTPMKYQNRILSFYSTEFKKRVEEDKSSEESIFLEAMIQAQRDNPQKIPIFSIAEFVNTGLPDREKWTHTKIGYICRRLGFNKTRGTKGRTAIILNQTLAEQLAQRYGLNVENPSNPSKSSPVSLQTEISKGSNQ